MRDQIEEMKRESDDVVGLRNEQIRVLVKQLDQEREEFQIQLAQDRGQNVKQT